MLHPTVRLVAWGVMAAMVQFLPSLHLALACAAVILIALILAPQRLGLLLRRTRWLILSLVLLFALATPGVYLIPALGRLGPTAEGLRQGLEHLLRLVFVIASLAVVLQRSGVEGLVAGLHGLMRPFAWFGFDRGRMAVRLLLVLHYVEQAPPGRHWREWLEGEQAEAGPMRLRLQPAAVGSVDLAVLAGLAVAAVTCFEACR